MTRDTVMALCAIRNEAWVVQSFRATATHSADVMDLPATGRHVRLEGVRLHTMKNGLIQHEQRIDDVAGLLIQMGVLKSNPAA